MDAGLPKGIPAGDEPLSVRMVYQGVREADEMTSKLSQTGLKWPLNVLKLSPNRVIFWRKHSHFHGKPSEAKELGYCPPPDISKGNESKELRRIMTTSQRQ